MLEATANAVASNELREVAANDAVAGLCALLAAAECPGAVTNGTGLGAHAEGIAETTDNPTITILRDRK
jgi:hypothetical protein